MLPIIPTLVSGLLFLAPVSNSFAPVPSTGNPHTHQIHGTTGLKTGHSQGRTRDAGKRSQTHKRTVRVRVKHSPTQTKHIYAGKLLGTQRAVYRLLRYKGLTPSAAAGVMGNMAHESAFNVETDAMDSNGLRSYGLISWNVGSYPNAASLVTGHPALDMRRQVDFLLHYTNNSGLAIHGGANAPAAVASRWAQFVEVCQGCWPGGTQNVERSAAALSIYRAAKG